MPVPSPSRSLAAPVGAAIARGCLGSDSQGDLEEIPQPNHIPMSPVHGRQSTTTFTHPREAQTWLRRAWKMLGRAQTQDLAPRPGRPQATEPQITSGTRSPGAACESLSAPGAAAAPGRYRARPDPHTCHPRRPGAGSRRGAPAPPAPNAGRGTPTPCGEGGGRGDRHFPG